MEKKSVQLIISFNGFASSTLMIDFTIEIDTDAGIVVDVEATPAHRTLEVRSTRTMIVRVEDRFAIKTKKLIGDTAYGAAEFLG